MPKTVKELQTFLGIADWFSNSIKNYSKKTAHVTGGTKQKEKSEWNEDRNNEFNTIKKEIKNIESIGILDYERDITLRTDASNFGWGCYFTKKLYRRITTFGIR
ncbi:hypothetical protein CDIK_1601 [Cucumispora dikerogammari]|nr:hypothetical protein CDIK_1601 [Cucumispora dikerogammari]